MSSSAILSSLLSSSQLAGRASALVQPPVLQAGGDFEQMLDRYETPAASPAAAATQGSNALQGALASLVDGANAGSSVSLRAEPAEPTPAGDPAGNVKLAKALPAATPATTPAVAASLPVPVLDPAKLLAASLSAPSPAPFASVVAKTVSPGQAPSAAASPTPAAKAAVKNLASDPAPESAAPTANAAFDIAAAFLAPVLPPAAAPAAPELAAAAQTIASALAAPTQGVDAPASEAPAPPSAPRARLSAVLSRTHLTVQDSRLFQTTSARTLAALEAPASPSAGATPKPALTLAVAPAVEAPAPVAADALPAPDAPSITPLPLAEAGASSINLATPPSLPIAELPDRIASEATSLAAEPPARGPVKELQFQLDPADLGTVYVKLRVTTGRLSVDIGVSNPGALAELETQRDAMTSKLEATAQPLESLVIHPQAEPPNGASSPTAFFCAPDSPGGDPASRKPAREGGRPSRPPPAPAQGIGAAPQRSALVV